MTSFGGLSATTFATRGSSNAADASVHSSKIGTAVPTRERPVIRFP